MRAEDKELEGPELEREVRYEEIEDFDKKEEEELPAILGEQVIDIGLEHRGRLFDALQSILANQNLNVSLLYLPQREAQALEQLQAAVTGRDSVHEFLYAEDRRVLFEQALAVLQANLTQGDHGQLAEIHAKFDSLSQRLGEIRGELLNLEDSQEDRFDDARQLHTTVVDDGTAAKPSDAAPDSITDFISAALSAIAAAGPEVPDKVSPPSTLVGPDLPDPKPAPTTLVGPEVPDLVTPPSTLVGKAIPDKPEAPTTLLGPEVTPEPKVSTLAEPKPAPARVVPRTKTPPKGTPPKGSKKRG